LIQWEDEQTKAWKQELSGCNPNELTPMEALLMIQRWKELYGESAD
jgi:hypothetical protein